MIFITCFYQISSHNQYSILNNHYTLLERRYWIGKGKGPPDDSPFLLPLIIQREDRRACCSCKNIRIRPLQILISFPFSP